MADRATEILDGCTHGNLADPERTVSLPCRPCALRAIEAAREEERARIVAVVRRNVDGPMREALVADIEEGRFP